MKIVRFSHGQKAEWGIQLEDGIQGVTGDPFEGLNPRHILHRITDIHLLPPCLPTKIVALGVNYKSHGEEMSHTLPTEPLLFLKPSTSVIGPEDEIVCPDMARRVDYEGELGVVIKTVTRQVSKEDARDCILGYTCVNDVTARDLQLKDGQWTRAKGFDTFCPIGPCIETEINPADLSLGTYLNGQVKQYTRTSQLIFGVYELVSFVSHVMTLLPGDIIATGTTSGIGAMHPGDTVEVKIEGIGTLRNYVVESHINMP
jgi:2-keto-4-pentenoate hydratase/2-oxohepta-3-ene-1,7-dioic acid hydratase in catechol pathway